MGILDCYKAAEKYRAAFLSRCGIRTKERNE